MTKLYTKNTWADEVLSDAERYDILDDDSIAIYEDVQINLATSVVTAGTAVDAAKMNNIENGIDGLDDLVVDILDTYISKNLYDANSILAANSDNTPAAITVAEQTLLGRITGGNITALTVAQVQTLLEASVTDWTPTWTNLTVGNGTVTAKYIQSGKIINAYLVLTFGSTTSISGNVSFTLPAAPINPTISPLGTCILRDTGTAQYLATVYYNGSNGEIRVNKADGTYVNQVVLSSSVPHTWTTSDEIHVSLSYIAT